AKKEKVLICAVAEPPRVAARWTVSSMSGGERARGPTVPGVAPEGGGHDRREPGPHVGHVSCVARRRDPRHLATTPIPRVTSSPCPRSSPSPRPAAPKGPRLRGERPACACACGWAAWAAHWWRPPGCAG